jgi:type II secretory ATPase GspE/PulE/Tfp pilus assembly ATPase PilB-like protein
LRYGFNFIRAPSPATIAFMPSDPAPIPDARPLVDDLLRQAMRRRASDIHVEPSGEGYGVRLRVDGLLETASRLDPDAGRAVVARLMVMAHLLTYRLDVPQEGRISLPGENDSSSSTIELRLAIMPALHGLRAAIRMPAEFVQSAVLQDLGLSDHVLQGLLRFAAAEGGMLILTGPAGSGKTTTIYALLRHIIQTQPGISLISLEDPVERDLPGVTQIEVSPFGQLTYEKALRSILRQDPQVLMLGEIRDAATASLAVQAALSGHRLITTLHAATPGGAIARLQEMGIEPYQLTSSIHAVVSQRLARRRLPDGSGYRGRVPLAELVVIDPPLKQAILSRADADTLQRLYAKQADYQSLAEAGGQLVSKGLTDAAEIERLLGPLKN